MKVLILTGGKSSRMGQPKADLQIGGQTLLDRAIELLKEFTKEIHLSIAHHASLKEFKSQHPEVNLHLLPDLEPSPGPLGGLQAAFHHDPHTPWLILAIDLPRIGKSDLARLTEAYHPEKDAVSFLNPLDHHPEPLCALYSPSAAPKLAAVLEKNQRCARRFLASLDRVDLEPLDPQALLNLNRPEHLAELEHLHQHGPIEKSVTVEYFAKLSQEAGMNSENSRTSAATLTGLWEEVRLRHHLTLDLPHIKPALNNEFAPWESPLKEHDTIAFMPPFAGG